MRRVVKVLGWLVLLGVVLSIADTLLRAQHPCEQCGAEMSPFERGSSIYKCPRCGFMVDTGYQR